MNQWSKHTLDLVTSSNYLDQLQVIYPHEDSEREVDAETLSQVQKSFEQKNDEALLNRLLDLERFPYKDSYVGFLRKDREAIKRNPKTVRRICSKLYLMGLEKVLSGLQQAKEANQRRGNQFSSWAKTKFPSLKVDAFMKSIKGIYLLEASEQDAMNFCNKHLHIGISKRPDLVAKTGKQYVIGEAKFLSSTGGNQGRAFDDGIKLATNSDGEAHKVFVLDGVHWIERGSSPYKRIEHSSANIFSALLLQKFLTEL